MCDDSLDSIHIVLAKKFNRVVWLGFERRLFDGFVVVCDGKCGERGIIYVLERGEKGMTFILVRSRFSGSLMSPVNFFPPGTANDVHTGSAGGYCHRYEWEMAS